MKNTLIGMTIVLASGTAFAQTVIDLGRLPGGTYNYGGPLSDNGTVVCGSGNSGSALARAWRWTSATGMANLGVVPGADHSYAYGMSGDGLVVIGASGGSGPQAYDTACRWTQATGLQTLGSIAAGQPSFASDASTNGAIVFGYGYEANSNESAWKWTSATGMQRFGQRLTGTSHSVGLAMTGDGSFYTGYCFNNAPALIYPTACRWAADGTITSLGVLGGSVMSVPSDLSANGAIVIGYAADGQGGSTRAFKWTAATGMQDLGMPAGCTGAVAAAITGDGSTIVGYGVQNGAAAACIWDGAAAPQTLSAYLQTRGVSTSGWTLETASVSADGSAMTGSGSHNGVSSVWYVSLGCNATPVITQQPVAQNVSLGAPATFSVVATGGGISFQWYKGVDLIPNATQSVYTIPAAAYTDAGSYSCHLTSSCGNAVSNAAALTVQSNCPTPVVVSHPSDIATYIGETVSFQVSATSSTELHYQWRLDSVEIGGAIDARLDIEYVTADNIGMYDCVISNSCGSVTSDSASLNLCRADFNQDHVVDFNDYLDFVDVFANSTAAADFNNDSIVDFNDYLDFVDAFSVGC